MVSEITDYATDQRADRDGDADREARPIGLELAT